MVKRIYSTVFIFFLFFVVLLYSETVHATAISDTEIIVDWNTLVISGGAITKEPFEYKGLHSDGWINGGATDTISSQHFLSSPDWLTANSNHVLGNNSNTMQTTNDLLIDRSISSSSGGGDTSGWINGNLHRGTAFYVYTTGTYTFSLNYSIDINLSREDALNEWASSSARIAAGLYTDNSLVTAGAEDIVHVYSSFNGDQLGIQEQYSGNLTFSVNLIGPTPGSAAKRYWFETHQNPSNETRSTFVSDSATVPEPTTMVLFGLGLLGLAGVNRRTK